MIFGMCHKVEFKCRGRVGSLYRSTLLNASNVVVQVCCTHTCIQHAYLHLDDNTWAVSSSHMHTHTHTHTEEMTHKHTPCTISCFLPSHVPVCSLKHTQTWRLHHHIVVSVHMKHHRNVLFVLHTQYSRQCRGCAMPETPSRMRMERNTAGKRTVGLMGERSLAERPSAVEAE